MRLIALEHQLQQTVQQMKPWNSALIPQGWPSRG